MMHLRWQHTPAVTGITTDGHVIYYRAGAPILGRRFRFVIVRTDHPSFEHRDNQEWLRHTVVTSLDPDGQWIEVTG